MIDLSQRLIVTSEEIAGKVIDGEAIVMHLGTGAYYSMNAVASRVWELSEAGHTLSDVSRAVAHDFGVDGDLAQRDVLKLARELVEEGLLKPTSENGTSPWAPSGEGGEREYQAPELEKYSDMADLLALDPPMPGVSETPWSETADP